MKLLEAKFFDMVGKESNHEEIIKEETRIQKKKVTKSVRGMPWLPEAKKDVISCEKPRGGANNP